ncbi:hypothetical protein GCM10007160_17960 [Litchfieldella qijiaojingensis]|uniref:DUF3617 family protein n=1 Tax=Litchfieldella qijiaojingensis TaxID=980347 RepID=A0ABQ2YR61_9GAMM|nr:hypothetical protein [Halomonas qijiaojingensis]GGX90904.1 hypothetical protein GCM10007160_17960 [Halomonas qijiaojingensis]
MIKRYLTSLLLVGLTLPMTAMSDTLRLPEDAAFEVRVIDDALLTQETPTLSDLLLQPVTSEHARYQLPSHCLITADARLEGERVRISAKTLTCIDTQGADSEIFSGELSAAGMESDGSYAVDACIDKVDDGCERAELRPSHVFQLRLGRELALEPKDNPAARINEQRRQAQGEGVANPIPGERPDPDAD